MIKRVTALPKIGSSFLDPEDLEQGKYEPDVWMYQLPEELIERIRKSKPKDYWNKPSVYLVFKMEED